VEKEKKKKKIFFLVSCTGNSRKLKEKIMLSLPDEVKCIMPSFPAKLF
jgi:hypothetical protein